MVDINEWKHHGSKGIAEEGAMVQPIRRKYIERTNGKGVRISPLLQYVDDGKPFSPLDTVRRWRDENSSDYVGNNGYVFVCHSQGCNNLLQTLNAACSKGK